MKNEEYLYLLTLNNRVVKIKNHKKEQNPKVLLLTIFIDYVYLMILFTVLPEVWIALMTYIPFTKTCPGILYSLFLGFAV